MANNTKPWGDCLKTHVHRKACVFYTCCKSFMSFFLSSMTAAHSSFWVFTASCSSWGITFCFATDHPLMISSNFSWLDFASLSNSATLEQEGKIHSRSRERKDQRLSMVSLYMLKGFVYDKWKGGKWGDWEIACDFEPPPTLSSVKPLWHQQQFGCWSLKLSNLSAGWLSSEEW